MFPEFRRSFPAVFTSTSVNTSGMEVARLRVSIEADATILIAGGSGTERTAYVALAARRMVIPIASFGGAASAVLRELGGQRSAGGGLPRSLSAGVLSQDWSTNLADHIERWLEDAAQRRDVFVVYGRNLDARDAAFSFLRSLKLNPLDWDVLVQGTGKPAPFHR